jgi:hypothetical protein
VDWLNLIFGGIGVALIGWALDWWFRRRNRPTPPDPSRSLVKGNVGENSRIRRVRMRDAHHLVEGDVGGGSDIDRIDFR